MVQKSHSQPPGMYKNPVNGINYIPTLPETNIAHENPHLSW